MKISRKKIARILKKKHETRKKIRKDRHNAVKRKTQNNRKKKNLRFKTLKKKYSNYKGGNQMGRRGSARRVPGARHSRTPKAQKQARKSFRNL